MAAGDTIGFLAASLVLASFCMRSMSALRYVAIASNIAFITYGCLCGLLPIVALHVLLLPVNVVRLMQVKRDGEPTPGQAASRSMK